ncbi:hypothetical protein EJB05_11197, partial [Eragrostis curvula]
MSPRALKAALAKVAVPKFSLLHIGPDDLEDDEDRPTFSSAGVASLLRTAARLDPIELRVVVCLEEDDRGVAVKLPRFARTTSILLDVPDLNLIRTGQGGGEFPMLERLSIRNCFINTGALISRCPFLRVLELDQCEDDNSLVIHSDTIEELVVVNNDEEDIQIKGVHIVAPVLKKFRLCTDSHEDFTMSIVAPMLENLSWDCGWRCSDIVIEKMWCLGNSGLELNKEESGCIVLRLDIHIPPALSVSYERKLQEIFQLPKFSVLELNLETCGHVYGPMVLNLLRSCNGIQRLKLATNQNAQRGEACTPDCPCDQPQNWRSQNSMMGLEEVEIENFKGTAHEVDFMKVLFRCSPLTKVVVKLESNVSTRSRRFKEIYSLFKENPFVECHVYRKCGKEVMDP